MTRAVTHSAWGHTSHEVSEEEGDDDLSIPQEGAAKELDEDQGDEHNEAKTQISACQG